MTTDLWYLPAFAYTLAGFLIPVWGGYRRPGVLLPFVASAGAGGFSAVEFDDSFFDVGGPVAACAFYLRLQENYKF